MHDEVVLAPTADTFYTATMHIHTTSFIKSAVNPSGYPESTFPEVAFAGRSNVGKSSLINTIIERKGLVKTSSTPGRTQLINFFHVHGTPCDLVLVDLPGYGYAKVPLAVKRQWGPMMERYLAKREQLKAVVLILDIRRQPTDEDLQMLTWLQAYGRHAIIVLTKCDKVSKTERSKQTSLIANRLQMDKSLLIHFSSLNREGKDLVWLAIEKQIHESSPL